MAQQPFTNRHDNFITEDEYLRMEQSSDTRHEYIDGCVYAMVGASLYHARITANILGEFRNHLKGKACEAFMTDVKIKLGSSYVYPDVVVDCSGTEANDYFANVPILIVEVLSQTTRKRDLTTKLFKYINLPTLQEYVLIEQNTASVTVLRRAHDWQYEYYVLGDSVTFESIGLTLRVEEIYDRVNNHDIQEYRLFRQDGIEPEWNGEHDEV